MYNENLQRPADKDVYHVTYSVFVVSSNNLDLVAAEKPARKITHLDFDDFGVVVIADPDLKDVLAGFCLDSTRQCDDAPLFPPIPRSRDDANALVQAEGKKRWALDRASEMFHLDEHSAIVFAYPAETVVILQDFGPTYETVAGGDVSDHDNPSMRPRVRTFRTDDAIALLERRALSYEHFGVVPAVEFKPGVQRLIVNPFCKLYVRLLDLFRHLAVCRTHLYNQNLVLRPRCIPPRSRGGLR
jgi:hypothetical protein